MESRCNFNEIFFVIFLFVTMVGLSTILLFIIPWIYRMVKRCYQTALNKNHTRLREESDLISLSSDCEKIPIDYTDPTDSDLYLT